MFFLIPLELSITRPSSTSSQNDNENSQRIFVIFVRKRLITSHTLAHGNKRHNKRSEKQEYEIGASRLATSNKDEMTFTFEIN